MQPFGRDPVHKGWRCEDAGGFKNPLVHFMRQEAAGGAMQRSSSSSGNNRIELAAKKTDPITDVLNNKCGDAKQDENNLWSVDASRCSEMMKERKEGKSKGLTKSKRE